MERSAQQILESARSKLIKGDEDLNGIVAFYIYLKINKNLNNEFDVKSVPSLRAHADSLINSYINKRVRDEIEVISTKISTDIFNGSIKEFSENIIYEIEDKISAISDEISKKGRLREQIFSSLMTSIMLGVLLYIIVLVSPLINPLQPLIEKQASRSTVESVQDGK
ncbi:hypothetical protein [Rhizobium sp. CF142]|uniref:hypothetical protein n=1 Tax=Rhizobium sp. CF142 TaxID=1144314 RepID=UPI00138AD79B|nr:hypothetical protein [Rhizobium sp. CF142]